MYPKTEDEFPSLNIDEVKCNTETLDNKCKNIMKNEFSFNKILITNVKKPYATVQKVQEEETLDNKCLGR